jgi:hypothetical protein
MVSVPAADYPYSRGAMSDRNVTSPNSAAEGVMSRTVLGILVALAVLAATACTGDPAVPGAGALKLEVKKSSEGTDTVIDLGDLVGTWQATKAEGTNHWDPNIRRDLVAEGGTVTLVLETAETQNSFTVTLTMPGEEPRVNYGIWYCWDHEGRPQIDFWPGWIPREDLEYGDGHGMYYTLSGNTLTLSDGGGSFLLYDFGWHDSHGNDWAHLELALTRSDSLQDRASK